MSDVSGDGWTGGRRRYLKGVAATGVAASLAGCVNETIASQIVGLDPEYAESTYDSADHETATYTYHNMGLITVRFESHGVTYDTDQTAAGQSTGFGVFTTPVGYSLLEIPNPLAQSSILDLLDGENAKTLLEGFGITVPGDVNWEEGPTQEEQDPGEMTILGNPVETCLVIHGVLRSGNTLRAVSLHVVRLTSERGGFWEPNDLLFAGSSVQRLIEDVDELEAFRDDTEQMAQEQFDSGREQITLINPDSDLAGFD